MAGMTSNGTNPKRWRPGFSLRTLVIFVTLVCVYFGAWEATKTFGVPAVEEFAVKGHGEFGRRIADPHSPMPFCVHVTRHRLDYPSPAGGGLMMRYYRRYYLWFFGLIVHLKDEDQPLKPAGKLSFEQLKFSSRLERTGE